MAATTSATAEMALDADGNFLALRVSTLANMGAYLSTFAPCVPTYLYATLLAGVYKTPVIYCEVKAVFTNTVPVDAYRGAGRPEATFLLERLVDACAHDTGIDRVEIRRKNFIPADAFPYQTPVALQYDSGNYQATLDACAEGGRLGRLRGAPRGGRGEGQAARHRRLHLPRGLRHRAVGGGRIARRARRPVRGREHPGASDRQRHGVHRHAQPRPGTRDDVRAARLLDSSACRSTRSRSCTATPRKSRSAWAPTAAAASRSAASAMVKAMDKIIAKGKKIAAHLMEASVDDIEFKDGTFTVAGTDKSKTLTDISLAAYVPHNYPIEELEPGLDETAFYDPKNFTFPGGCHVAEVEIDPDTGVVEVVNFVAVDDVGRVINPMIVEGQVQGGVAQGIGQALLENAVYDDERAAAVRLVHGLHDAARRRPAEHHGRHRDHAVHAQSARREGLRRGGRDRLAAGGHQRRRRCAEGLRRAAYRHAGDARRRSGRSSTGRRSMAAE